jgi:putative endonuclease
MDREQGGGWVYMMSDRYRGTLYVGVTANLPQRIFQHRDGTGSDFCARYGLHRLVWAERGDRIEDCIAHEKRLKRWRREWKFALIERANPDWSDMYDCLVRPGEQEEKAGPRIKSGVTDVGQEWLPSAADRMSIERRQCRRKLPSKNPLSYIAVT